MYRIRDVREDRDLSQKEIAKVLHTTQQQYSKYETGTQELPARHIVALCKFYKVSADAILGIESDSK